MKKMVYVLMLVGLICSVVTFYPALLHAAGEETGSTTGTTSEVPDNPGKQVYDTAKDWWEGERGVGLLVASGGLLGGAIGFMGTKKPAAFLYPAVGGILAGSAFAFGKTLFNIGMTMFGGQ